MIHGNAASSARRGLPDNFHGSITDEIEIASVSVHVGVHAAYRAVMISYPRPKAVAVPADYHGNQVVLTGA